jgi:ureidoacrylate peracid hydrolase
VGTGSLTPLDDAALLVVDVQHAFCDPEGSMARSGADIGACAAVVGRVAALLTGWRATGRPVVFTRYALAADGRDAGLLPERSPQMQVRGALRDGTLDAALVLEAAPAPGEPVVVKTRYSAFHATDLEPRLLRMGVDTVVVCGVTTNVCVEATARDAFARDLRVVVARDACASTHPDLHHASLRTMELVLGDVTDTDTILRAAARTPQEAA